MSRSRDVAVGGAVGAVLRAGTLAAVGTTVVGGGALAAIVAVNLLGAYGLGWLCARAVYDPRWAARLALLGTGLAGALTTFSGLALQLVALAERAGWGLAVLVAVAHVGAGLVLAWTGLVAGHAGRWTR